MVALQRFNTGESPVASSKLNLIVDSLTGAGNTPINHAGVNDAVNYSLTVRNQDAGGKGLIVYAPDGVTVLFQVTAAGVLASSSGAAATGVVTTTGAQTLTGKTLTSTVTASFGTNPAASQLVRLPVGITNGIAFRNAANTADLAIAVDNSNELYLSGFLTATTASAGTSGATPAQVDSYLIVNFGGTAKKIPMYAF